MGIVAGALLGICLGVPTPVDIQKAAKRVFEDASYQREMPGRTRYQNFEPRRVEPTRSRPTARRASTDSSPRRPRASRRSRSRSSGGGSSGGSADLGNALIWMLLIVGGVLVLTWLVRLLGGYTKDVELERPKAGAPPPRPPIELAGTKTKAERLADAGRFDEAIHVLLLETLGRLAGRMPGGMQKSWTSREILERVELPDDAREALRGLVTAVEVSLFGHDVPGRVEYMSCTRQFEQFAEAVNAERAIRTTA
ncbi:MAG: hypothetical protein QNJ98_00800 [Planctomycetota bacterium]|nr:hypothetical protein [Planctomycetota bacterium]